MKRLALLLLVLLAGIGCGSAEKKVLTSINSWAWANARYEERCVLVVGTGCHAAHLELAAWRKRLDEAALALVNKGGLPRQLAEIRTAEKNAVKALPKEKE